MGMEIRDMRQELETIPDEVLLAIGVPSITFYNVSGSFKALCPFHSDKHLGSFGYNPHTHCWGCFACGESGKGVFSLVMRIMGWNFVDTVKYLYAHKNDPVTGFETTVPPALIQRGKSTSAKNQRNYTPRLAQKVELPEISMEEDFLGHGPISPADLDRIYRAFAEASPLSAQELQKLRAKRGLTFSSCSDFFRFPSNWDMEYWKRFRALLKKSDNRPGEERLYHSLLGVPGFYWDVAENRPGFLCVTNGLGILNHGVDGLITGIEIRTKAKTGDEDPRYIGFSSASVCERYPDRCKHGAKAGFLDVVPRRYSNTPDLGLAVTEGKFKALHLSYKGYTGISIRGIGNWRKAMPLLAQMAADKPVTIAFDADMKSNPAVAKSAVEFAQALMDKGFTVQFLSWPLPYGKGFDDLCNNGYYYKAHVTPAQRYLDTTLLPFLERVKKQASA